MKLSTEGLSRPEEMCRKGLTIIETFQLTLNRMVGVFFSPYVATYKVEPLITKTPTGV
jgi:hypothetical protein